MRVFQLTQGPFAPTLLLGEEEPGPLILPRILVPYMTIMRFSRTRSSPSASRRSLKSKMSFSLGMWLPLRLGQPRGVLHAS